MGVSLCASGAIEKFSLPDVLRVSHRIAKRLRKLMRLDLSLIFA